MANALSKSGYRSVSLHRQPNGRLSISAKINGKPTQLGVSTGAPISAIDRGSAQKFGLREEKSDFKISGAFSVLNQRLGIAPRNTVEIGNIVQTDVAFAVYNEPSLTADSKGVVVGLFGSPQLSRLGAIVDCGAARLYLRPSGPNGQASARLGELMARRGFTRIPLQINSRKHFEAACRLNEYNSVIMMETFASVTSLTNHTASAAGIASAKTTLVAQAAGGTTSPVKTGQAREFSIGRVLISNPNLYVTNSDFNIFGMDNLARYSAVIDLGTNSLYLRRPRPAR